MRNVVITSPLAESRTRDALVRALKRFPADVESVAFADRAERLLEIAADEAVEYIAVIDDDAVLAADAFGALRRSFGAGTAIVGGRALVGATQRLGAMFGPPRSGPNPFELYPIAGLSSDRGLTDIARGAIDVPQRGAFVVTAAFVRTLPAGTLDPLTLALDLAVRARAAHAGVVCEPSLTFTADEDPVALRDAVLDLRRYAMTGTWHAADLHRDPQRMRASYITREARVMGNIRGYARRPYPPIDLLAVVSDEISRSRVQKTAGALALGGSVAIVAPGDVDALRAALARTGDRYLVVADGAAMPSRATIELLVERVERNGGIGVALEHDAPPYGTALFHSGRIINGRSCTGETIGDVLARTVAQLPEQRLFAAGPAGTIVPDVLPPLVAMPSLDVVFVAASRPVLTQQTLDALLGEIVNGSTSAVFPAGAATTEKLLSVYPGVRQVPDGSDAHLAVGLNRALAMTESAGVLIVRDDAQIPRGTVARLQEAFRRMPRLGVAVPRIGGADRPESLPDLGYRDLGEMQSVYDRRAEAFAREATLLDVATAPVMIVRREVLDLIGGFDEMFGLSRCGVEDFTRRVRAANFLVAVCEDAYAHHFAPKDAQSLIAGLDDAQFLRAALARRWSEARGFDPERDRVALSAEARAPLGPPKSAIVRVLVPIGSADEFALARPLLAELAAAFRAADPVEVAIGLDGSMGLSDALAELRDVLNATNVPMDETLNVNLDVISDMPAWRDVSPQRVRAAMLEREALSDVDSVTGSAAVRALLLDPVR